MRRVNGVAKWGNEVGVREKGWVDSRRGWSDRGLDTRIEGP